MLGFAKSQIDYILGPNPRKTSHLVDIYGPKYPTRAHHLGSSIASYKEHKGLIGCTQGYDNWYRRSKPNPSVLVAGLWSNDQITGMNLLTGEIITFKLRLVRTMLLLFGRCLTCVCDTWLK